MLWATHRLCLALTHRLTPRSPEGAKRIPGLVNRPLRSHSSLSRKPNRRATSRVQHMREWLNVPNQLHARRTRVSPD